MQISTLVGDAGRGLDFVTNLPTDVLLLAAAVIALTFYGVRLGKYRVVALLFALYPAAIATPLLSPYLEQVVNLDLARSVVFLGFALVAHIGFSHIVCCEFSGGPGAFLEGALFGILITGVALTLGFAVGAIDSVHMFSNLVRGYATGLYALLWVVASVAVPIATARRF